MISLLMTVLVMGSVVSVITLMMDTLMTLSLTIMALKKWMTLMDISKEVFTVGKRSSMVVNLEVKQLNNSVEKIFARKTRLQNEYKSKHRICLHFGRGLHIVSCFHITIINTDHNFKMNALFSNTK